MLSGANAKQMVVIHVEQGHAAVRNMVLVVCQLVRTACLVFPLWRYDWDHYHWCPCSPPLFACTTVGRL